MAVRDDFAAGEVLAAADLNDTFASKLPYSYGTATPSTSDSGFLWYDSNSTPAEVKFWDGAAFQALTSGKILQVVRATDTSDRSTTSASFVDVTGMSVSITPTKSTSAILVLSSFRAYNTTTASNNESQFALTDSSNNAISGAENMKMRTTSVVDFFAPVFISGYATPATTSAVTYKLRFRIGSAGSQTVTIEGATNTSEIYAIEVSA